MKKNTIVFVILTLLILAGCADKDAGSDPNFLFILVDDLGYMDVGFNNPATFYETRNIDRLASESMVFTNAYAACPVCSPTRASIMTGKYPAGMHTTDYFGAAQPGEWKRNTPLLPAPYKERLPHGEVTIAEALRDIGYHTFFAGKWHLGDEGFWPENQGFDVNIGGITRGGPYGGNKYFSPYGNPRLEDGPEGEHLPDRLASETCAFIEANKDSSFLAYLSFYSVHTPLIGRPDLVKKYERKKAQLEIPDTIWGMEGKRKLRLVQEHTVYAAMVEAMDLAVGKVLDKLEELGIDDRTVIVFMSDNGGLSTSEGHPTSNLPLRAGKGWLYEGGIREPMIIKWPGITRPGSITEQPVISVDFFPTIMEMAGALDVYRESVQGESLVPLLRETDFQPRRKALFWHYPHYGNQGGAPGAAIRSDNYKLIDFFGDRPSELYDLEVDPGEKNNLAGSMSEKVKEMDALLHEWQKEQGALFPTENPDFDPGEEVYY
ncbi:MAG: sulfatase [Bacteroidales bacterium]|nr:sulfatase [Bacteroidales bacterium]